MPLKAERKSTLQPGRVLPLQLHLGIASTAAAAGNTSLASLREEKVIEHLWGRHQGCVTHRTSTEHHFTGGQEAGLGRAEKCSSNTPDKRHLLPLHLQGPLQLSELPAHHAAQHWSHKSTLKFHFAVPECSEGSCIPSHLQLQGTARWEHPVALLTSAEQLRCTKHTQEFGKATPSAPQDRACFPGSVL